MYPNYPNFDFNNQPQRTEIKRVNGKNGAEKFPLYPNSEVILLDTTAPIIWLAQTDSAGYKTLTPYTISPYQPEPEIDIKGIDARLRKIEEMIDDAKSNTAKDRKSKSE